MKHLFITIGAIFFLSCTAGNKKADQHVYWVNSTTVSCVGQAPSKCLQVQKSETLDPLAWDTFPASIEGFEYEPGYIYKIVVKETHIDPADLPADVSSIEYTLVEILEKRQDMKLRINDIWLVIEINGKILHAGPDSISFPRLEINVGEMRYTGNDACNNFNGGIIELDESTIRFGVSAATRMMCSDMEIPDLFNTNLPEVASWKIKENKLYLSDTDGKELIQLRKSD